MKKILGLFASLALISGLKAQHNDFGCSHKGRYANQLKTSPFTNTAQVAQQQKYDVTFYKLDLEMTNLSTNLAGTVEIHAKSTQVIDSALIELYNGFTISEIKVNGVATTAYSRVGPLLNVPINLPSNQDFVVAISYSGAPPTAATNPLGGSGMTNDVSPNWNARVTWSLSEPFSAFEWFPCKQYVKDKADSVQVSIKVPDNLMAGSNGVLDSISTTPGFKTFHWMHRHPIAYYLISVAVSDYQEYNVYANPAGATSPVLIQNFIYNHPNYLNEFQDDIDETVDMIELFADLFGPYPYDDEKYGHCLAPLSGGMEHQTMTTQGWFDASLTAHELAHQWWGNYVTCGSWADIWINEGFASYSEYLMFSNLYSFNNAQQRMNSNHNAVMQQLGGSVYVTDSLNEGAIFNGRLVYQKGGAIIHTLRHVINDDDLFFNMLRAFLEHFKNSNATGLEFKVFAEDFTDMDLTDFFNQWYYGEGYPTYSVAYNQTSTDLNIEVSQTTSRPAVTPLFTTPLDLRVTRTGMSDTIIRVNITNQTTSITIPSIPNFASINGIDPLNDIINRVGTITNNGFVSIEDLKADEHNLVIFPNPTAEEITVKFEGSARDIRLVDQKGKTVLESSIESNGKISLKELPAGQYLVVLSDKSIGINTRIVIKN